MTRKDFVLLAATLRTTRSAVESPDYKAACELTARNMAHVLANDNPRFDRARFLGACGVQS